jgi:hypothetical protein
MLALLAASGITGIFVFQGIGLWTSVLSPRAIPFTFFALTWRLSRMPCRTLEELYLQVAGERYVKQAALRWM